MIVLLILISLVLGLHLKFYLIPTIILTIFFLVLVFLRYKKKILLVCFLSFVGSAILSFIYIPNNAFEKEGIVVEAKENYYLFQSKFEKYYVYEFDNDKEIGDFLKIKGNKRELNFSKVQSQFDFETYLNKKGVYYELSVTEVKINFKTPIRLKDFKNHFLNNFNEETRDFISSLLFSSGYEGEEVATLQSLQLNRLISTSGLYLYALLKFLEFLLSFVKKEKAKKGLAISFILLFQIILFPKLSVLRFTISKIFSFVNRSFLKEPFPYLTIHSLSLLFLLLFDFHFAYQDAFIIGLFLPIFIYFIRPLFKRTRWWKKPIVFSIAIYIFFIPFTLKFNCSLNLLMLPVQVLLSPILIVFYMVSLLALCGIPLYEIIEHFFVILKQIIRFCGNFSLEIYSPPLSFGETFLFYLLLILFFYYLLVGFKPIYKRIALIFGFALSLYFIPIENLVSSEVYFINVGQGDACLIRNGNTAILIDTGGSKYVDIANECLIPFFKSKRIYDIDLVITTHNDYDHNGALNELVNNFKVDKVVTSKSSFPLEIGGIMLRNLNTKDYEEDNDNSLVINFKMWGKEFLIMGDASKKVEEQILNENHDLQCDILKIGHHGSDTSTSERFIKTLMPDEAIISVGTNYYGHPHKSVLTLLDKYDVRIRRTDIEGTIRYANYIFM